MLFQNERLVSPFPQPATLHTYFGSFILGLHKRRLSRTFLYCDDTIDLVIICIRIMQLFMSLTAPAPVALLADSVVPRLTEAKSEGSSSSSSLKQSTRFCMSFKQSPPSSLLTARRASFLYFPNAWALCLCCAFQECKTPVCIWNLIKDSVFHSIEHPDPVSNVLDRLSQFSLSLLEH